MMDTLSRENSNLIRVKLGFSNGKINELIESCSNLLRSLLDKLWGFNISNIYS